MLQLTRAVRFAAAHRYWRPEWDEERNRRVFGACANPHGHGHNYVLEVTVAGEPDPETGFVFDLGELDRILREEVVERLDHQHLNHAVEEFREGGLIPTTENIVRWLWGRVEPRVRGAGGKVVRLRLREDVDLWAEWDGDPGKR